MPDDLAPGESIFSWAVPLNDAHTPDDDGFAATLTFVDSLLNGVTTVIEAGTIGHLAPGRRGRRAVGHPRRARRVGLGHRARPVRRARPPRRSPARPPRSTSLRPGGRVEGWVTLVGHDLASDALLAGAAELARERGARMTMHISPTSNDPAAYLARTGVRPIVHLDRLGVLGPHLLLAHAVWLDDEEVELIAQHRHGRRVCPWAYLHHGQGVRDGRHMAMHRAGVAVGLGCDAPNANDGVDILDAARLAVGLAKDARDRPDVLQCVRRARDGHDRRRRAAGLADRVGSLEVGKAADLVVHDAPHPQWRPRGNPVQQLVWAAQGRTVRDVWSTGASSCATGVASRSTTTPCGGRPPRARPPCSPAPG